MKKLDNFLQQAKKEQIIDDDILHKLQEFDKKQNSNKGTNIFINVIGFFGVSAILLGLILIISHNWQEIPDIIKISLYLFSLLSFHLLAIKIFRNYPKLSTLLHFLGAGYIIAGIGLIAQIYNLSSSDGKAFLLWFVMIIPLTFILRNRLIGAMSILVFYLWLNTYLDYYNYYNSTPTIMFYYSIFAVNFIVISKLFKPANDCFAYLKIIGIITLSIIIIIMGFSHNFLSINDLKFSLHPLVLAILIFNFSILAYLMRKNLKENLILSALLAIITILPLLTLTISLKENFMIISVLYWLIHFLFGAFFIYIGIIKSSNSNVNFGVWYITLAIIIRFLDIVNTMLKTGMMFVILGSILLLIAYLTEKYRKILINKYINKIS